MKIEFWVLGKTSFKYLEQGIQDYVKRLKYLTNFRVVVFSDIKEKGAKSLLKKEAKQVLNKLNKEDHLILLDERGKMFSSIEFAKEIEKRQMLQQKKIVFLIGG